jgi:hypothetical protein
LIHYNAGKNDNVFTWRRRWKGRKQTPSWLLVIIFLHGVPEISHETTQTSPLYVLGTAGPLMKPCNTHATESQL